MGSYGLGRGRSSSGGCDGISAHTRCERSTRISAQVPSMPLRWQISLRVPLFVTFHGFDVTRMPHARRGRRYVRRLQSVFEYASVLIAVSGFIKDQLIALGAPQRRSAFSTWRILGPRGLTSTASPPAPGPQQIVFVGRLVEKKGARDLLEAIALMSPDLRGTPLVIAGYGPAELELKRRSAELGLNVSFIGRRSSAQIASLLRRSTVFVGPSQRAADGDSEGFGMVFLEAGERGATRGRLPARGSRGICSRRSNRATCSRR